MPTGPLADWPCASSDTVELSIAAVYGRPVAAQADWQADPEVRALVNFAAAPENAPDQGSARLRDLGQAAGPNAPAKLLLALDGIMRRTNQLRAIVAYGIREKVEKSKLLADLLGDARRAETSLPADAPAGERAALEADRLAKARALGDNAEDVELLCHRFDYLERKARRLAGTISSEIDPKQN